MFPQAVLRQVDKLWKASLVLWRRQIPRSQICLKYTASRILPHVISNFLWRRVDWAVNAAQRAYAYAAVGISAISNLIIAQKCTAQSLFS